VPGPERHGFPPLQRFLDEHQAICDAIGAGDARAAGRLVEAHLDGARAGLEGAT
jgi:DNA-binding GntR family transcriptional regulator